MKNERPKGEDMKTQNVKTITPRSFLVAAAAVGMLLLVSITPSYGQKEQAERATTRDGLTVTGFMTNPEVSDDLDGTEDEYFYKFQAVPGKLTLTLEVTANETNAGAMLDLFGVNNKAILSNLLAQAANGGSERVSKSVNISKKQEIIIRIKGLRYGSSAGYPGTYKIVLEGAVSFNVAVLVRRAGSKQCTGPVLCRFKTIRRSRLIRRFKTIHRSRPIRRSQSNTPAASDAPVQNNTPDRV